jgi:hypothetical protein
MYRGSFLAARWQGLEVGHSPPPSAEVKNEWSYGSTLPIRLHGVGRDYFTFYILPSSVSSLKFHRHLYFISAFYMP